MQFEELQALTTHAIGEAAVLSEGYTNALYVYIAWPFIQSIYLFISRDFGSSLIIRLPYQETCYIVYLITHILCYRFFIHLGCYLIKANWIEP
jgi:hypothetical protein